MGFAAISKLVDFTTLTGKQKQELKAVLQEREKKLKAAIADVEEALSRLGRPAKKAKKRKSAKRRR